MHIELAQCISMWEALNERLIIYNHLKVLVWWKLCDEERNAYQNDLESVAFQLSPSDRPQYSTMKIEMMVSTNITTMLTQRPQEKGSNSIQKWMLGSDSSGTIISRLDCIYGCVKSTNFNRSLVIVKSATTPSTSFWS